MAKLTTSWMDRAQRPGLHWDPRHHGLGVRVWSNGQTKSWVFQKSGGRRQTIGRWPSMSVSAAHDEALIRNTSSARSTADTASITLRAVHEAWARDFLNRGGSQTTVREAAGRIGKHAPDWWARNPDGVKATDLLNLRSDIVERSGIHPARDTVGHIRRLVEQHTQTRFRLPDLPRPPSDRAARSVDLASYWPEIVKSSSPQMLDAHLVVALTGLRQGEVLQMRRSHVSGDSVFIPNPKSKMGRDLSFHRHLPQQVLEVLDRQLSNDVIFPFNSIRTNAGSFSHRLRHHFIGLAESETAVPRRVLRALVNHTGKTDVTDGYGSVSEASCSRWSQTIANSVAEKIGLACEG